MIETVSTEEIGSGETMNIPSLIKRCEDRTVSTGETAKILGVSQHLAIDFFDSGSLQGHRLKTSKKNPRRRILLASLVKFMSENNLKNRLHRVVTILDTTMNGDEEDGKSVEGFPLVDDQHKVMIESLAKCVNENKISLDALQSLANVIAQTIVADVRKLLEVRFQKHP